MTTAYVGTVDAAAILGWSTTKVKREAQAGRLPHAVKAPGRTGAYLFDRTVLDYIATQQVVAA